MRKWHRWLSVFFGAIMVFVTVTGLLHYVVVWWPTAAPTPEQMAAATPPAGFTCPEGWRCMAPRPDTGNPLGSMLGLFHHLHSGSEFGLVGEIVVMLSGMALLFFSISGLWMYVQMWSNRRRRRLKGSIFWK